MDKQQASKEISDILDQVDKLYQKAADIADEAEVDFSFSGPGGTYGAGGWYTPKPKDWVHSDGCWEDTYGWQASGGSC